VAQTTWQPHILDIEKKNSLKFDIIFSNQEFKAIPGQRIIESILTALNSLHMPQHT